MSEHTGPAATSAAQHNARYRVTGRLPMTLAVTAGTPFEAETAAREHVIGVLAEHHDVRIDSIALATGGFAFTGAAASSDQSPLSQVRVIAIGHIDVVAEDRISAQSVALDAVQEYLAGDGDDALAVLGGEARWYSTELITDEVIIN